MLHVAPAQTTAEKLAHDVASAPLGVAAPILALDDVSLSFGGVKALAHVDLAVRPGAIHAVIGPNGAGKSSLINVISGLYGPTAVGCASAKKRLRACRRGGCRTWASRGRSRIWRCSRI